MSTGKFKPKIPVRRQEETTEVAPKPTSNKSDEKRPGHGGASNNNKRQGQHGAGRGPRPGRGNFMMPTGKAFFTGGGVTSSSSVVTPSFASNDSAHTTSSHALVKTEESRGAGGYGISAQLKGLAPEDEYHEDGMSVDSDEEGNTSSATAATAGHEIAPRKREETWPPTEHSTTEPLALPFGPRSVQRRQQLLSQPLFAHPDDSAALAAEERSDMLLLQVPSTLLSSVQTSNASPEASAPPHLASGYLGKLQVMKSGRVFLVVDQQRFHTENEKENFVTRYEITSGIPSTFKQVVSAISTSPPANSETAGSSLYMLGSITKKAVVTPDFDSVEDNPVSGKEAPIDLS